MLNFNTDIIQNQSPNFNSRLGVAKCIVMHWTAGSFTSSRNWFLNPSAQASAHFMINRDGSKVIQFVPLNKRAWHAGSTAWHPVLGGDINSQSVGIELEGPPSFLKKNGWDKGQMDTLRDLCLWIKDKSVQVIGVTDHSTILPTMKSDVLKGVGVDLFPWNVPEGFQDWATPEIRAKVRKHFNLKN